MHWFSATLKWQRYQYQPEDRFSSWPLTPSFYNLLCHSSHRTWDGDQVVAAKVDFCQCGNVTNGQRKLTEVVVRQVEAPQARKPGNKPKKKKKQKKGFLAHLKSETFIPK